WPRTVATIVYITSASPPGMGSVLSTWGVHVAIGASRVCKRSTSSRPSLAMGSPPSMWSTGRPAPTVAIGPCSKSAIDIPSAKIRAVSFTFSAVSSAAAYARPRAVTSSRSYPTQASASAAGGPSSDSTADTAPGTAASSVAPARPSPSAPARTSTRAISAVTVLVAGTASSAPASVDSARSLTAARALVIGDDDHDGAARPEPLAGGNDLGSGAGLAQPDDEVPAVVDRRGISRMQARGGKPGRPGSGAVAGGGNEHGRVVRRAASDKGDAVESFRHDGPHPVTDLGGRIGDAL